MRRFEVSDSQSLSGDFFPKVEYQEEPTERNILSEFGYFDQMTANDYMPG